MEFKFIIVYKADKRLHKRIVLQKLINRNFQRTHLLGTHVLNGPVTLLNQSNNRSKQSILLRTYRILVW